MAEPFAAALQKIGTSQHLGASLDRAHRLALDQRQGVVTLEHLLFALTEDAEAGVVFSASRVDLNRLRADISGYLGRLPAQAATDGAARPNPELLRILQAAAAAARQSPRKQIDGAVVLAAMIGDANTPSAALLKTHGLTFEEAIRALQRAGSEAKARAEVPAPLTVTAPATGSGPSQIPVMPHAPVPVTTAPLEIDAAVAERAPQRLADKIPTTVKSGPSTEELLASVRARIHEQEPPKHVRPAVRATTKKASPAAPSAPLTTAEPEAPKPTVAPTEVVRRTATPVSMTPASMTRPGQGSPPPNGTQTAPPPPFDGDAHDDSIGAANDEPEFRIDPHQEARAVATQQPERNAESRRQIEPPRVAAVKRAPPPPVAAISSTASTHVGPSRTPPPLPTPPTIQGQSSPRAHGAPMSPMPPPLIAPLVAPDQLTPPGRLPQNADQDFGSQNLPRQRHAEPSQPSPFELPPNGPERGTERGPERGTERSAPPALNRPPVPFPPMHSGHSASAGPTPPPVPTPPLPSAALPSAVGIPRWPDAPSAPFPPPIQAQPPAPSQRIATSSPMAPSNALPFPRLEDRLLARPDLRRPPVQESMGPLGLNLKKVSERIPRTYEVLSQSDRPVMVDITLQRLDLQTSPRGSAVTLRLTSRDASMAVVPLTPETVWLNDMQGPQDAAASYTWHWSISALDAGASGLALQLVRMVPGDDGRWAQAPVHEHKFAITVAEPEAPSRKRTGRGRMLLLGLLLGIAVGVGTVAFLPLIKTLVGL
jgi:hypothetical protein